VRSNAVKNEICVDIVVWGTLDSQWYDITKWYGNNKCVGGVVSARAPWEEQQKYVLILASLKYLVQIL
jgi:hypothetical protein